MVNVFIPDQTYDKNLAEQYFDVTELGTLDILGATFQETMYYNPANALGRLSEQFIGEGRTGRTLTKDEWAESEYFRPGIEVGEDGIKEGLANLFAQRHDKRLGFRLDLNRSKGGFGLGAAQFGVGIGASFLDPLNVASAFIPSVALARGAVAANRIKTAGANIAGRTSGKRFLTGAMDGAIGAAVLEPLVIGAAYAEQDKDYTIMDSFLNLTFGSILGGGLHVGVGKIYDRLNKIPAPTREQALRTSVVQAENDENIQVDKLIDDAETTTINEEINETDTIVVYNANGEPRVVEKVEVDQDGTITIRDTDGKEKVVDESNVISKSPYEDDFKIDMTATGEDDFSFDISELTKGKTKKDAVKSLEEAKFIIEDQLQEAEAGVKVKGGLFKKDKIVIDEARVERKKASLKALEIQLDKLKGKKVVRPKDPITNRVTQEGETETNTVETLVETQEGVALTQQQLEDQANSRSIQSRLGTDSDKAEDVLEIEKSTEEIDDIKLEEIEAENELLLSEIEDETIIANMPEESIETLNEIKAGIRNLEADEEKAKLYDEATIAGARCVLRNN
jgi:hypothetical protein